MPQTIGELINNLALKAGILADNPDLKGLLANEALATIQVPDELVGTIDKGLLSIDAAKNNHPDIKKKYFADAYDGMDKQLMALVASDTFDQSDLDEIAAERSTSKKAELIVSKLKSLKKQDGGNAQEWNKKIADANEAARLAKLEVAKERTDGEGRLNDLKLNYAKKAVLSTYKTIYDDLDGDIKVATMEAIMNKNLQDKNAILQADENGNITLVGKDGTNVFGSNNVQLTAKSFLDQTFAPILKVTSGTPPVAPPTNLPTIPTGGAGNNEGNSLVKSLNDAAIAAMNAQPMQMM